MMPPAIAIMDTQSTLGHRVRTLEEPVIILCCLPSQELSGTHQNAKGGGEGYDSPPGLHGGH